MWQFYGEKSVRVHSHTLVRIVLARKMNMISAFGYIQVSNRSSLQRRCCYCRSTMYATSALALYCSKWNGLRVCVCRRDLTECRIEKASIGNLWKNKKFRVATKAHSTGTIQCNHNLMLHKILHHVFVPDFHLKHTQTHTLAALFICIPHCILRFTRNLPLSLCVLWSNIRMAREKCISVHWKCLFDLFGLRLEAKISMRRTRWWPNIMALVNKCI